MRYPVIDADGHVMERPEHFAEFLERPYQPPRVLIDEQTRTRYWLIDGKLIPRPAGEGVGVAIGFIDHPSHPVLGNKLPNMRAKDNGALDDISGRLADLDQEGITVQVVYPTTLLAAPFIRDKDYAAALCRAYNNYVSNRIRGQERLRAVAVVPIQDPPVAIAEMRRAIQELGFVGVMITPVVGDGHNIKTLDHPDFLPFFEEADRLNTAIAVHSVAGAYDLPWANIFDKFYYTHSVAHPFSQMIGLMTIIGGGLLERFSRVRFAILESGCGWLPFWLWWLDAHYKDPRFLKDPKTLFGVDPLPYLKRPPSEYARSGRVYFHAHEAEPLLPLVVEQGFGDQLMYASDYPHDDAEFPHSVREMRERADLSDDVKAKILGGNALRFYQMGVPATVGT
jgi:predicted TIM-barrel fold metal-dependent hydrolase